MEDKTAPQLVDELIKITTWQAKAKKRKAAIEIELIKRKFPKKKQGSNKLRENEIVYTLTCAMDKKVDESALEAVLEKLPEGSKDRLFNYTPKLVAAGYKEFPEHLRKIIDQALIITPKKDALKIEIHTE
ncbi:MAG: hypothetical protein CMI54_05615 [Parcubacteria group bacterium]|jgi:hypothetical protein|nr:hypothetical protein [Parcubacteria group bacterium]|tara:strand:+ start:4602 stop:4991 length:390 start_codon:yes stop_codon:yes gene_type:complete